MVKILLADLVIEIDNKYPYIPYYCREYSYNGDRPTDIFVSVSEDEIAAEALVCDPSVRQNLYLEYICAYRKIAEQLPKFNAFVMHGTVIRVENKGIAFMATSGTGKTTHMLFWRELCGDKLTIINGDKPIIRIIDGVPYAYGTPWAGKENYHTNDRVAMTDLCFIERSTTDEVINLSGIGGAMLFINQIYRNNDPEYLSKTYALADEFFRNCNLRKIKCTKNISAAKTAYDAIFK